MTLKVWAWILLTVTTIGGMLLFYADFFLYAGVISAGTFIITFIMQLYFGIHALVKEDKKFLYAGLILIAYAIIAFLIAVPGYTYKDAEQAVLENYPEHEAELLPLDHKTIPADSGSWYLTDKWYYVAVKTDRTDKQADYYAVDPVQGDVIKLDEAYWMD